ncbi:hypothetical protein PAPYR_6404 [Paratrimastix pyriformis]|uniref:RING-type domain-containing protein n=1 Tax=Paratrimastix pyriformis TaxID=342808 RepID=A0ABQ8UFE7_9EUKA|nr:hypothetical protein PAPYR_6404 [Paratrimastix pyriformis]
MEKPMFQLPCKKHVASASCLMQNAMQCPHCSRPQQVFVFIDDSAFRKAAREAVPLPNTEDPLPIAFVPPRYDLVVRPLVGDRIFGCACLIVNDPQPCEGYFSKMEEMGCTIARYPLHFNETDLATETFKRVTSGPLTPGVDGVIVLVTGDRELRPAAQSILELAEKRGLRSRWTVEIYTCRAVEAAPAPTEPQPQPPVGFRLHNLDPDFLRRYCWPDPRHPVPICPPGDRCDQCHRAHVPTAKCPDRFHALCYECLVAASMTCPICSPPPPEVTSEQVFVYVDYHPLNGTCCHEAASVQGFPEPDEVKPSRGGPMPVRKTDGRIRFDLIRLSRFVGQLTASPVAERHLFWSKDDPKPISNDATEEEAAAAAQPQTDDTWFSHTFQPGKEAPSGTGDRRQVPTALIGAVMDRMTRPLPRGVRGVIALFGNQTRIPVLAISIINSISYVPAHSPDQSFLINHFSLCAWLLTDTNSCLPLIEYFRQASPPHWRLQIYAVDSLLAQLPACPNVQLVRLPLEAWLMTDDLDTQAASFLYKNHFHLPSNQATLSKALLAPQPATGVATALGVGSLPIVGVFFDQPFPTDRRIDWPAYMRHIDQAVHSPVVMTWPRRVTGIGADGKEIDEFPTNMVLLVFKQLPRRKVCLTGVPEALRQWSIRDGDECFSVSDRGAIEVLRGRENPLPHSLHGHRVGVRTLPRKPSVDQNRPMVAFTSTMRFLSQTGMAIELNDLWIDHEKVYTGLVGTLMPNEMSIADAARIIAAMPAPTTATWVTAPATAAPLAVPKPTVVMTWDQMLSTPYPALIWGPWGDRHNVMHQTFGPAKFMPPPTGRCPGCGCCAPPQAPAAGSVDI